MMNSVLPRLQPHDALLHRELLLIDGVALFHFDAQRINQLVQLALGLQGRVVELLLGSRRQRLRHVGAALVDASQQLHELFLEPGGLQLLSHDRCIIEMGLNLRLDWRNVPVFQHLPPVLGPYRLVHRLGKLRQFLELGVPMGK